MTEDKKCCGKGNCGKQEEESSNPPVIQIPVRNECAPDDSVCDDNSECDDSEEDEDFSPDRLCPYIYPEEDLAADVAIRCYYEILNRRATGGRIDIRELSDHEIGQLFRHSIHVSDIGG